MILEAPLHPTSAVIDRSAFRHNLAMVRAYVGDYPAIMPVVKADAYGHGAIQLSREAIRLGVRWLAVARYHEGLALRAAGIDTPILVFEVVPRESIEPCLAADLRLTVVSDDHAEAISRAATRSGHRAVVHVKVDTGMGRLGVVHEGAAGCVERIVRFPGLTIEGIYSHFATSEDPDQSYAREQLRRFTAVLNELEQRNLRPPLRHMANSGAVITLPESHFDIVRPGIMLYGYPPARGMNEPHPVRPVMALRSRVSFLKAVPAGTSISYGRRYSTTGHTTIATIPVGYADGFARLLTGKSHCIIRGRRFPVVGTVCMDHVMADLGPEPGVQEGDEVTLIGRDGTEEITAWDVASAIGTIPYEVTSLITPRVPRLFVE
jgi:alanine racemase